MHGQERASTKYGNAGPGASHRPHAHLRGGLQLSGRSDGHVHNRSWFFSRRHGREGWHETDQGNEDSHEATLPSQGFPVTGSGHRVSRHTRCTCRWQNPAYSPGRGVVFGEWPDVGPCTTCVTERSVRQEGILRKYVVTLAKANLTELARGGTTISSLGGQTKNAYALTRTPGGSSGGTGAAIAANFASIGTGSDTGQSIRSPASAGSLVGLRPTRGLVSRDGIIPLSTTQDAAGPITRTVEDAARMLDAIAGYDPNDPITAFSHEKIPESYTHSLDHDGLAGARIGVLVDFFGTDAVHEEVNAVTEAAIDQMAALGATMIRMSIPDLDELTRGLAVSSFETKIAFNAYLADLGSRAPVRTLEEFIERGDFHEAIRRGLETDQQVADGLNDPEYRRRLLHRQSLRQAVMTAMADHDLDAILYPHQRRLVATIGEPQLERNGVLSNGTGFPAITLPGGFSTPTASAPLGVPIGIELLGAEWGEPRLIELAFAFEQATGIRRPPVATPPL